MGDINRLTCELSGSLLLISVAGGLETGDLINFSYKVMRQLDRIRSPFYTLVDIHEAAFNVIEGLERKISKQFNDLARAKNAIAMAYVLSPELYKIYSGKKCPEGIKIFTNASQAMDWLASCGFKAHEPTNPMAQPA